MPPNTSVLRPAWDGLDKPAGPASAAAARQAAGGRLRQRIAQAAVKVVRALSSRQRSSASGALPPPYNSLGGSFDQVTSLSSPSRLLREFPELGGEQPGVHSFVCSLDHARVRWYGRMYVCHSCVCFAGTGLSLAARPAGSASVAQSLDGAWAEGREPRRLRRRTQVKVHFADVTRITKELTLGFCPNAITVATGRRHYIFTNFVRRDRAFALLSGRWQTQRAMHGPAAAHCRPCEQRKSWPPACESPLLADAPRAPARERVCGQPPDPIGRASRLIGAVSRNTVFVLVSVVVFCLLSLALT
ncbi:hypothetical protein LPJ70_005701 [Coemansia sp. RSA 2708]|nr:hypothetical protein LPJ70_005701 [Coemansia sp. RSA 2708]KAJ2318415.1 Protein Aster-B [Coemansia sp. RSA 2702]